ncbi:hypothetical protein BTO05_10505 [Winogradskyella sp. PC-19]|uniref:DUF6252 family protein n=1 Tax=unclassified Winogradskyella TaxID=2615021 RepID=UPI000B3C1A9E|nr:MULTISPECIES: DUF6252 family protein [unclassified Winogradskyella]ARV10045.1 hypothetical protein BTO05_10505 [Winogradskyella sp. PC-19]RZN77634.1 MAG: hypothetical protein EVB12_05925 [Winogradskyella sp.]
MNKNILLIFFITLFFGCVDDVEFNNPAIQANFEGQSWIGVARTAAIKDGGLIIRATRGTEVLLLFTTRTDVGTYPLGANNQSEARYISADGTVYSTLNSPDPSIQVFPSDGLIKTSNIDSVMNTATGTFRFNAFTADGLNSVNFIDGVFFQITLRQDIAEETGGSTCALATDSVSALNAQVTAETPSAMLCEQYLTALEIQLLSCDDSSGDIQQTINNLDCNDDDADGIPNSFEDINMDGNLDNDDTDMDGIPNYQDADDDGDSIDTINETGDTDGDAIPNYLDNDDDGDSILTIFEDPIALQNTDGDGFLDYLDADDDNDGALTIDENPDPNGDGNPDDAQDTDMDGIPDYLQI